jgi:uncharacterized protein with von Willebrand factor type A (vWA) domain
VTPPGLGPALARRAARARARRTGQLPHDVAVFAGLLREVGVPVSPASTLQAVAALDTVRLDRAEDVRAALACCLAAGAAELVRFEAVYDLFWAVSDGARAELRSQEETAEGEGTTTGTGGQSSGPQSESPAQQRPERAGSTGRDTHGRAPGRPGRVQAARRRDVEELARRLARALGTQRGRRQVPSLLGEQVDLRASIRHALGHGGELIELRHTRRRRDRARLVVLCDVSSSMRASTPLFLAFVHALTRSVRRMEVAVFDVDTVVVTEVFRRLELRPALAWLAAEQVALAGGTRIGHCLHAFLDDVGPRAVLGPETTALVLSDGWDVGEPELLSSSMHRLRSAVGRVVWCDPHAAAAGFDPQVQGLQVALPFVDDHLDFSSVASLTGLVDRLAEPPRPPIHPRSTERTP